MFASPPPTKTPPRNSEGAREPFWAATGRLPASSRARQPEVPSREERRSKLVGIWAGAWEAGRRAAAVGRRANEPRPARGEEEKEGCAPLFAARLEAAPPGAGGGAGRKKAAGRGEKKNVN